MSWAETYTGKRFDYHELDRKNLSLEDIVISLSRQPRFNGHTDPPLSVLEHSIWVSRAVKARCHPKLRIIPSGRLNRLALRALFHDAAEAYVGDVIRPLKRAGESLWRHEREIQDLIYEWIGERIGGWNLDPKWADPIISHADYRVLRAEGEDLMSSKTLGWTIIGPDSPERWPAEKLRPLTAEAARSLFVEEFESLDKPLFAEELIEIRSAR